MMMNDETYDVEHVVVKKILVKSMKKNIERISCVTVIVRSGLVLVG
jgi:hypothetical protein